MEGKIIQAIDIGTTKVAAIVARITANDKLEILGIGVSPSFGVIRADVKNINQTIDAIQKAVSAAEKQSGITFTEVYVGIAGSHVSSRQHRATLMRKDFNEIISQKDIEQLKDDTSKLALPPGDMIIEILPQDYKVDNTDNIQNPIGMLGNTIHANMHVITGSQTAVNTIKRCITTAGFKVKKVIMQPIASAASVLSKGEMEAGVVLVDIGGGTTDVAIFVDGIIGHTAVIPFGGEIITEDIKKGCRILKETAESIKVQHGQTFPSDNQKNVVITIAGLRDWPAKEISMEMLVGIIQARMEEILHEVINEIRMSGLESQLNCGIVLTGGGSQLKHLRQLTEYESGYKSKIGVPNEHLSTSTVKNVDNPIFSTAIGLAIKGIEIERSEQELYEQEGTIVDNPKNVEKEKVDSEEKSGTLSNDSKEVENQDIEDEDIDQKDRNSNEKGKGFFINKLKEAKGKIADWINSDPITEFQDKNLK
ncbi:MAG TPA: cell division protein FtsA [Chitinophagales bacterium]|nr:cell division protein FtsA [Chitinophagales bacterium]